MAGTADAPDGDTAYVLTAPPAGALGFVLELGNRADGDGVWIANVDATPNQVNVQWHGSREGVGSINLSGKGDEVFIPAGDIVRVIVTASAYPTTIGWAYILGRQIVHSGQRR
jgi:hypothetical protein